LVTNNLGATTWLTFNHNGQFTGDGVGTPLAIAADAITSTEIAADAVGSSEIAGCSRFIRNSNRSSNNS